MLICMFTVLDFGVMLSTFCIYCDAARFGVRYAVVHGSDSPTCSGPGCTDSLGANVSAQVSSYAGRYMNAVSGVNVQVSYPDSSCAAGSRVVVTVSYQYLPLAHYPGGGFSFSTTSQGRIVY